MYYVVEKTFMIPATIVKYRGADRVVYAGLTSRIPAEIFAGLDPIQRLIHSRYVIVYKKGGQSGNIKQIYR